MKKLNKYFYIFTTCLLIFSCSKNEKNSNIEDNYIPLHGKKKFICSITNINDKSDRPNYKSDTLIYENGKLVKAWFYSLGGTLYQFEYGGNNKIKTIYSRYNTPYENINNTIASDNYLSRTCYYNSSNLLIKQVFKEGEELTIDYDSFGRIYKIQGDLSIVDNRLAVFSDFDDNGNPQQNSYSYEITYDDKINPIYILFNEFGFFNIEMGNSLDDARAFYISPNNVTETIIKNYNQVAFSSIYSYDQDGYPVSSNYLTPYFSQPNNEVYTYLEKLE